MILPQNLKSASYSAPSVPTGDVTVSSTSIGAIAAAVWNKLKQDHQLPDSFGELVQETALSAKRAGELDIT